MRRITFGLRSSSLGALLLILSTNAFAQEANFSGLHLHVEQDLFVSPFGLGRDQNYTMGVGIQATGRWFRNVGFPQHMVDQLFTWAIPSVRLTPCEGWNETCRDSEEETFHSLMIVGSAFTPKELLDTEPVKDDRPYASFLGLVSSRTWVDGTSDLDGRHAITTELGVGFLGLDVSQRIQTWIHKWTDSDKPSGWNHQISDGGELTGFYHIGFRRRLTPFYQRDFRKKFEASLDADVWLGYYTNASLGTTVRLGSFYSRYFEFASAPIVGVSQALIAAPGEVVQRNPEFFVFGAVRGRGVLYNALLQGGFKESSHTLSSSEITRGILELELGVHGLFPVCEHQSLYATWVAIAGRSPEFNTSLSRWHWWGSLQIGITNSARKGR